MSEGFERESGEDPMDLFMASIDKAFEGLLDFNLGPIKTLLIQLYYLPLVKSIFFERSGSVLQIIVTTITLKSDKTDIRIISSHNINSWISIKLLRNRLNNLLKEIQSKIKEK